METKCDVAGFTSGEISFDLCLIHKRPVAECGIAPKVQRLMDAASDAEVGLSTGKGSVPFIITGLHGALVDLGLDNRKGKLAYLMAAPSVPASERKAPELKAGDLFADLDIGRRGRLYRVVMIVTKETHPDVREATAVCLTRGKVTNVAVRRLLHASRFERVKEGNTEKRAWESA